MPLSHFGAKGLFLFFSKKIVKKMPPPVFHTIEEGFENKNALQILQGVFVSLS
ncbi:MAG: hypothetical protein RL757_1914 [Bacteroidota bacterium]|jgi:hypothetical protein